MGANFGLFIDETGILSERSLVMWQEHSHMTTFNINFAVPVLSTSNQSPVSGVTMLTEYYDG